MIDELTPREKEVLDALLLDGAWKRVAHRLGVSEQTVKNHASAIYGALDVDNMVSAALVWDRRKREVTWPERERRSSYDRRSGERRQGERRAT